jgi:multidrug efflux pump subunit AcrA (membrane-fusion protein)
METVEKKSLLARILDGAAEAIKRPFVEKRIKRAFETAADSFEEQLMDNEAKANATREKLVEAAKTEGNLKSYMQQLTDLQQEKTAIEQAKAALAAEKKAFLD